MAKSVVNFNDCENNLPCFLSFLLLLGEESLRTRKSPKNNVKTIFSYQCLVPENIHTLPQEGLLEISKGRRS